MPEQLPDKDRFQQAYQGKAPWDIGKPQPAFVEAAERITGTILDVGCGTGENALFFAAKGHDVTAIDFLEKPISEARSKVQLRNLPANFVVSDALHLDDIPQVFDSAIDCGLFHVFSDDDRDAMSNNWRRSSSRVANCSCCVSAIRNLRVTVHVEYHNSRFTLHLQTGGVLSPSKRLDLKFGLTWRTCISAKAGRLPGSP